MKHLVTIILFGLLIIGCKLQNDNLTDTKNELDSIDYIVISSAIEQYFYHPLTLSHRFESSFDSLAGIDRTLKREDIKMLLIKDSTIQYEDSITQYVHQSHNEIDSSDKILTERIVELNKQKCKIDNSKITSFKTKMVSKDQLEELLDSIIYYGYDKLYKNYHTAYGIITISRPTFTDDKDKAIIYIGLNKGPKEGQGVYLESVCKVTLF